MGKKLFLGALAMAVTLPAMVAPVQAQEALVEVGQDFQDVSKTYWSYKEIMAMRDGGIINGYTDNTFKPEQSISRVHVAALFVRTLALKPVRVGKEFKDVPKDYSYYNDIQTVYRAGIFDGKPDGTFGIHDSLTRAQMAKVLFSAFDLEEHKGLVFRDVTTDHWAKDYIASLYMNGVTVGSNGNFNPEDSVSRAHYAVFLYRALNPEDAPVPEKPLQPDIKPKPDEPDEELPGHSIALMEKAVLDLTNIERQKLGLAPLQIDSKLAASARAKSVDMFEQNYFAHDSPTYGTPFDQMKTFGVSFSVAAENIGKGYDSADEVVNAWMTSPGHRKNILGTDYTHIGIGYESNGHHWTQHFIRK